VLTAGTWDVTTIAGVGNNTGYIDGLGGDARFNRPTGIAVDKTAISMCWIWIIIGFGRFREIELRIMNYELRIKSWGGERVS